MFCRNCTFTSVSMTSRVHSVGWRGKEEGCGLQALRAHVRKFRVKIFIVVLFFGG